MDVVDIAQDQEVEALESNFLQIIAKSNFLKYIKNSLGIYSGCFFMHQIQFLFFRMLKFMNTQFIIMKKYSLFLIIFLLAASLMSYVGINTTEVSSPLKEILNKTPQKKLPMFVILYNMDVEDGATSSPKFLHKYKVVTNANSPRKMEVIITDFLPVSKKEFLKHYNHLDMEIASKIIDSDDEVQVSMLASPPGYAKYIDKRKYGKWVTNKKNGEVTWKFRRRYRNLAQACGLSGFIIRNKDYTDYRHNYHQRQIYFGKTGAMPMFGTGSKFSQNSRRTSTFYDDERETRVRTFYKNYQARIGRTNNNIRSRSGNSGK